MDILRSAFIDDGREDLLKYIDDNDTRVINIFFAIYGDQIPFPEDVKKLLYIQMRSAFLNDMGKIVDKVPGLQDVMYQIVNNIDNNTDFDYDIMESLSLTHQDDSLLSETLRCMKYYASFYMDLDEI